MENIGVYIQIGGSLPESLIDELVEIAVDEISFYDDFNSDKVKDAEGEVLALDGQANYGLCPKVQAFCVEHGLSFKHSCDASGEYNADMTYWEPGMEEPDTYETNVNSVATVQVDTIKPLIQFMCDVIAEGMEVLPKNLDHSSDMVKELVKVGLDKGKDAMLEEINKQFENLAPDFEVPPFIITKE